MYPSQVKTLFLPGASGSADFWRPVADAAQIDGVFLSWPGLGHELAHPDIRGFSDLVTMTARHITEPVNIVAQSMGGVIAMQLAIAVPHMVRRLVLTATSGGVQVADCGGKDWRTAYVATFPRAALWILDPVDDLSAQISSIHIPTLLLWGECDPISPVAVGEQLLARLPNGRLVIIPGADHDLARTHIGPVSDALGRYLDVPDMLAVDPT